MVEFVAIKSMARKSKRSGNIDHILRDWPYDPQGISVRLSSGADGREVLQMRVDLGVLQLEITGRPDGTQPHDHETFTDYLLATVDDHGSDYRMTEEDCEEADREFVQFYHRRICWLALKQFANAVRDADHTLRLMDLCRDHSPDEQWTISHEQYRPFVLFHRTQASALAKLADKQPEAAIQEINTGLTTMRALFEKYEADEHFENDELVQRLIETRETVRADYSIARTLEEQLADAIEHEKYELAAKLRDEINGRSPHRR